MRVKRMNSDEVKVADSAMVKFKTAGNISVVQFIAGVNKSCSVKNISKDLYLDKKTGEIKEKKKSNNRFQSPKSVRKSINRLMDLIRCNVKDVEKCKWVTLTYSDVMTDGKKTFLDAKLFLRKLKRSIKKNFRYITVAEPQGERHGNSWHLHIILIFEETAPFIANSQISAIWGKGCTDIHAVFDGDGLALYFKAYLSDVEYEDETDNADSVKGLVEKMVNGKTTQFVKGERLKYYPAGMNLYSTSRGMKKPEIVELTNEEAMHRVENLELVYRETYAIGSDSKGNLIDKRYYKKN